MSTIDERESARYRQDVLLSYRAWQRYLEAQQTILAAAAEAQAGADPFEGLSSGQERAATAERVIAELPADKRELFEAIYDAERTQIQRQLDAEAPVRGGTVSRADPDEVARRALAHLLAEAQGLHRDDRRGLVPRGTPDAIKWLAIDLAAIAQSPPSATDYQVLGRRQAARRSQIVNLGLAAVALIAIGALVTQHPGTPSGQATNTYAERYVSQPYLAFNGNQTGHSGGDRERVARQEIDWNLRLARRNPRKPVVNLEGYYDNAGGQAGVRGAEQGTAKDARAGAYRSWLSGAAGFTYGTVASTSGCRRRGPQTTGARCSATPRHAR